MSRREGLEGEGGVNAACLTCIGDASGGSSGGKWVGAMHGGGGMTGGSPGMGRVGSDAMSMGDRSEGNGKGDESRGNDRHMGGAGAGDGEGMGMEGDWVSGGESGGNDVTGTNDGGEGDGECEKSCGGDNGQMGDMGERESIGWGMVSDCEWGCNIAWTVDGGNCDGIGCKSHGSDNGRTGNTGNGEGEGEQDLSDGSDNGGNISQAWEPSNCGLGTSSPGLLKH